MKAILALEDGSVFHVKVLARAPRVRRGLLQYFDDGLPGILTDPSYKGQIVTMTYPLIGNYGVNLQDVEVVEAARGGLRHPRTLAGRQQLARGLFAGKISGAEWHSRHPGN